MVRKGHFLTPYVVVLHSVKKANSCNKYAVCRACISAVGKDEAYKNKFTNTKRESKSTSKKKNIKPPKKRSHRTSISNDSSSENESDASYHSIANEFSDNEISQDINTLDNYIFRPLTSAQKHKFEQLLLEVTVSLLGGQILKETTSNESEILLKNAKRDQFDVTLTFDGTILITSLGDIVIWKAADCEAKWITGNEIVHITEKFLLNLNNRILNKRLQLLYRKKLFLPCYAYQLNLCVGDIFKELSFLSTLAGQAVGITSFFSQAKFWIGKLREEQAATYKNKFYALIVPNEM
ncbi:hypothetical protein GLOIN_2v1775613 [Rhizophagus irregularis DAOM 181602=DAOM 197198]|uniref:Uncharacterized protein n=1 Tax=Rhizophagus irregularis (strain DAOM 181602 / DAOM 197198 / MUCL 43194) TaxID=747089 RepID=A0A2P4PZD6_RHIID|nr:hypothetical protein GLOIN_2v1775613 [Rhizophagus irregularis DAOM 181602=DAOM 197198]POG70736.1 hypothetical protein GLOIN_2v1775613 [Rhizophagus irregularis DAOM 181602=DAOM 197198]GBC44836.2 hypothetical protein GLOIN_2v1775613 [Rhizophagus irregularis DAOM 181602=DAOM 197198]|eukprot:XP_025177602.1 hypothetical protein GLOIN_2v1775613 [Rhizophagus irregularis DAOM 181602=DAOM 197198]